MSIFSNNAFILLMMILLTSTLELATSLEGFSSSSSSSSSHHSFNMITKASTMPSSPCRSMPYPTACESALASVARAYTKSPEEIFTTTVQFAMNHAHSARAMAYNQTLEHRKHAPDKPTAMDDCLELLDISLDQLKNVLNSKKAHDIQTWLSSALTNQVTCCESLSDVGASSAGRELMDAQAQILMQHISNALSLHVPANYGGSGNIGGRKLLADNDSDGYPTWLSIGDRQLMSASPDDIKADAVLAQDGSGTHRTISEAIAFVSLASSGGRSVIYVKAGTYKENVNIPTKYENVMLVGDGKGKSVIVGSRSAGGGWSTYSSATVAAMGAGFIAKGLTIINSAGPSKQQAVALRVGSDRSVVTQCSLQGYQDTLYTHSNRQYYRDNDISGTVDFIFGNSAVVIQNCLIQPRRPNGGQWNSVTAQGRTGPNENTGISIQGCRIQGASDLGGTPTYLGRPWQKYARVVVMQTYLDSSINKAGWEKWSGDSGGFALSTLYFGEYANTGPGASTSGRVHWPGVHPSISSAEASKFTVANFILGDYWLPSTGVDYKAGL